MAYGALDTLFTTFGQQLAGNGLLLGALIFMAVVFIAFKSGIPLSGLVLVGILTLGAMVVMGVVDVVVFAAVLPIGALIFWRAVVATGG